MIRLLLVDYGEVISTPLPEDTITDLAALADQPRAIFLDRYWQHRPAYDLGQPPAEYWSEVLARDLSRSPQVVDRLTDIDVHGWLRPNPLTLPTLLRRVRRTRTDSPGYRPLPLVAALRPLLLQLSPGRRQARPAGIPDRAA